MGNFFVRLFGGLLFALFLSGQALAETIPATAESGGGWTSTGGVVCFSGIKSWSDAIAACVATLPAGSTFQSTDPASDPGYTGMSHGVTFFYKNSLNQNSSTTRTLTSAQLYSCPAGQNWTLSGTTCTRPDCVAPDTRQSDGTCSAPCPGRQVRRDGQCACDPNQLPGRPVGGEWPWVSLTGASAPSKVCDDYCERNTGFGLGGGGKWQVEVTSWTGGTCNGTTGSTQEPTPNKPPPCGASEGVLTSTSGSVRCVPEGTPGASTPTTGKTTSTVTHPDGSTTTTTTTTTRDPVTGTTTTSTTTTNNPGPGGGTQSGTPGTTTTTTDSGSGTGGTGSGGNGNGDGDGDDFCFKHPDSIVCKNNTFSGECTDGQSAPSCEGDAALCATAKAAFELKCGALGKKGTEYGQKLIEGQDDQAASLPDPKNPEQHNVSALSYSDGGGACPPDLVFNVMGRSTTISMAEVCTIGGWLGNIGVALSLLIGGFIVIGAIRS